MISPQQVHEAMQDAPVDAQLYRQARAAIKTMFKLLDQPDVLEAIRQGIAQGVLGGQSADPAVAVVRHLQRLAARSL